MDERELVRRCVEGEPAAWAAFVRAHADLLCRAVRTVLRPGSGAAGQDVEDVVQSIFLKLWEDGRRRLRTFDPGRPLAPWLFSIARREAIASLPKRAARDEGIPLPANGCAPPTGRLREALGVPAADLEAGEQVRRLDRAMGALPVRDHLLLRLVYFDGRSYEQAARFLKAPLGSISPWLARARERLRASLTPGIHVRDRAR